MHLNVVLLLICYFDIIAISKWYHRTSGSRSQRHLQNTVYTIHNTQHTVHTQHIVHVTYTAQNIVNSISCQNRQKSKSTQISSALIVKCCIFPSIYVKDQVFCQNSKNHSSVRLLSAFMPKCYTFSYIITRVWVKKAPVYLYSICWFIRLLSA